MNGRGDYRVQSVGCYTRPPAMSHMGLHGRHLAPEREKTPPIPLGIGAPEFTLVGTSGRISRGSERVLLQAPASDQGRYSGESVGDPPASNGWKMTSNSIEHLSNKTTEAPCDSGIPRHSSTGQSTRLRTGPNLGSNRGATSWVPQSGGCSQRWDEKL
jgi:hypothetical protein